MPALEYLEVSASIRGLFAGRPGYGGLGDQALEAAFEDAPDKFWKDAKFD